MRKVLILLALTLLLCCSGCFKDKSYYYRKYSAPVLLEAKDDAASVYFIRTHHMLHSGELWSVFISNGESVRLVDKSYRAIYLPPGEYTFKTPAGPFSDDLTTTVEAGKNYYVQVRDNNFMDFELLLLQPKEALSLFYTGKVELIEPVASEEYEAAQD